MALNNTTADALAADIRSALDGLPKGQDQSLEAWKQICRKIAAYIVAEAQVTVTIQSNTINTVGSAAAQTGPQDNLPVTGGIT